MRAAGAVVCRRRIAEAMHNGATRCLEPMERGEGEATLTRFYFERETRYGSIIDLSFYSYLIVNLQILSTVRVQRSPRKYE